MCRRIGPNLILENRRRSLGKERVRVATREGTSFQCIHKQVGIETFQAPLHKKSRHPLIKVNTLIPQPPCPKHGLGELAGRKDVWCADEYFPGNVFRENVITNLHSRRCVKNCHEALIGDGHEGPAANLDTEPVG